MLGAITSLVRKGLQVGRSLFTGKPPDSLNILGDTISYTSDGSQGQTTAQNLKHISIDQSFLGLFGSSLEILLSDSRRILIRSLDKDDAIKLKAELDAAILRVAVETAKKKLKECGPLVTKAHAGLHEDSYMSAWQMNKWGETYADLKFLCVLDESIVEAINAGEKAIECRAALHDPDGWRTKRNDLWVQKELALRKKLLDGPGKHPLTDNQKKAIVQHDNRVLAVAGAGTGKTTTVVGKVDYLLKTKMCKPEEILLLSFSKGAVEELAERIKKVCGDQVQVRTFHSLGLEIFTKATGRKPAIFAQSIDGDLKVRLTDYLVSMLREDAFMAKMINLLVYQFYPSKSPGDFKTRADYNRFVSTFDIRTIEGYEVKSNQEAQIANFLFLSGIKYVYEAEYKGAVTGSEERRLYKPDFYLPDYDIYIEHFGIDRNGNTAPWVDRESYNKGIEWKRELHAKHQTTLIETFSYDATEGVLSQRLSSELKKYGVVLRPLPKGAIDKLKEIQFRLKEIAKLLATTLTLYKGDRLTIGDLEQKVPAKQGARERAFLEVFKEVLARYEAGLKERGEIDFGDMITEAARLVEARKYVSPFKVFIVDEFQDISRGRAWLMNSLLEQTDDTRLLCVGDDWQSIYRFTGSDVSLMTGYKTQWPQAVRVDLDLTFRFNDKIQDLSSRFITRNPVHLKKSINCHRKRIEPAIHITCRGIPEIIRDIEEKYKSKDILILGRYKHTINDEDDDTEVDVDDSVSRKMTVHKAKGKEADYVIVNSVQSGRYGFPTEMIDDPLIGMFLTGSDPYPNAEERRLFYVAVTRARHEVWLRINPAKPSVFIEELAKHEAYRGLVNVEPDAIIQHHICPSCGGSMNQKYNKSTNDVFLSCSFYPRCKGTISGCPQCRKQIPKKIDGQFKCPSKTCGWKADACPSCERGYLIPRRGKYGLFTGCSMYRSTGCRGGKS